MGLCPRVGAGQGLHSLSNNRNQLSYCYARVNPKKIILKAIGIICAVPMLKIVRAIRPSGAVPQSVETDFKSEDKYNSRAGDLL